jgi:phosphohistidine phosphatase SixA
MYSPVFSLAAGGAEVKPVTLIRHANSSWKDPGGADFGQSLGEMREKDALTMGVNYV